MSKKAVLVLVLQVLGLALVTVAALLVHPALGCAVAGAALLAIGVALERD